MKGKRLMTEKDTQALQNEYTQTIKALYDYISVLEEQVKDNIDADDKYRDLLQKRTAIERQLKNQGIDLENNDENAIAGADAGYAILSSIRPKTAIINNSLIANKLQEIEQVTQSNDVLAEVSVDKGGKGKVTVAAFLRFDDANIEISGKQLTTYDKTVFNAICTLYEAGNACFTLSMVYRAMNGLTNTENIDKNRGTLEPIRASIERGILKRIKINATEQIKHFYPAIQKFDYENYFLPLEKIIVRNNDRIEECYKFLVVPPLYEYSKNIKQVISVDIRLLDSRKAVKNSPEVAIIREYLIQRIEIEKNKNTDIFCIKYDTLFQKAGVDITNLDKTHKKRKRDNVKKLLQNHFLKLEYIKGFTEYKEGRNFEGIEIML